MTPQIDQNVLDYVAEIDDEVIRTTLQTLIDIAQEPLVPGSFSRDVDLVQKATVFWQEANMRQRQAINRLLEGHQQDRQTIDQLQSQLNDERFVHSCDGTADHRVTTKAGPE